jgi:D-amino-acid dehydrogenase
MRIAVLGAGVVGTAAAYYLAGDGHEVVVVDRQQEAAAEASWGNAGLVSPGDSTAWASPEALRVFIASLFRPDMGIKVRLSLDPHFIGWTLRFLRQCTRARATANTAIKLRLAFYSRECINQLQSETGIAYDDRRQGVLYFYRSARSLEAGIRHMRVIAELGLQIEVVDRARLVALEPGLAAVSDQLAGGVFSPMDQTGDSCLFSRRLADWCGRHRGVDFRYNSVIDHLEIDGDRVQAVATSTGRIPCNAVVVALGADSALLARRIGIDLPVYPVKGYSATLPLDRDRGPAMGGVDEDRLMAYSRLGDRLRLAATAEFAGYDRTFRPGDFRTLFRSAHDLFPGAIDESKAQLWAGLRPMMPSSVPVLGRARYQNLYLDTGHGHVGWTLACGSGRLLADLVAGRKPDIDPSGLLYRN